MLLQQIPQPSRCVWEPADSADDELPLVINHLCHIVCMLCRRTFRSYCRAAADCLEGTGFDVQLSIFGLYFVIFKLFKCMNEFL